MRSCAALRIYHRICGKDLSECELIKSCDLSQPISCLQMADLVVDIADISGTYNNQYMLLDLKKVELKKTLQNGALWIVEQIPG